MSYFLPTVDPGKAEGQVQRAYDTLMAMFQLVPNVFVAQSIRPDLLELMVNYVNKLMIETHGLPRRTKELIAAYVSRINSCAY
jgi:alkylhydroperoxidase family enzyme